MIQSYRFIVSRLSGEAAIVDDAEGVQSDRILVKKLGREFIIKLSDIEWMESSGNYVNLHVKGRVYPSRNTLSGLIEKIADQGFCRVHRSYAVNLDSIQSIEPLPSGDGSVLLENGKELKLSRRYRDQLKQRLTQ